MQVIMQATLYLMAIERRFSFETVDALASGGWSTGGGNGKLAWRHVSASTRVPNAGPDEAVDGIHHLYAEMSASRDGATFDLTYDDLQGSVATCGSVGIATVDFAYHMRGEGVGSLTLKASPEGFPVWSASGPQGHGWQRAEVPLGGGHAFVFVAAPDYVGRSKAVTPRYVHHDELLAPLSAALCSDRMRSNPVPSAGRAASPWTMSRLCARKRAQRHRR